MPVTAVMEVASLSPLGTLHSLIRRAGLSAFTRAMVPAYAMDVAVTLPSLRARDTHRAAEAVGLHRDMEQSTAQAT